MFGVEAERADFVDAFLARIDPEDRPNVETQLRRAISGEANYDAMFRVNLPDGGRRVVKGLGAVVENVRPRRIVGVNFDVTAEHEAATLREMMLREMNHRIKNMFAVIASIVRGAGRGAKSAKELVETVTQRIQALSNAHSLALNAEADSVALKLLVEMALEPYAKGASVEIDGPALMVPSESTTSMALIFHEWATNAAKYGVLGPIPGKLVVEWSRIEGSGARLEWVERYATPRPATPAGAGFGSRLVASSCASLHATLEQKQDETSYRLTLEFAVDEG